MMSYVWKTHPFNVLLFLHGCIASNVAGEWPPPPPSHSPACIGGGGGGGMGIIPHPKIPTTTKERVSAWVMKKT